MNDFFKSVFRWDASNITLIIMNILTIYTAVVNKLTIDEIMAVYLIQGLFIWFFAVLKILLLKNVSAEGVFANGVLQPDSLRTRINVVLVVTIVLGGFYFVVSWFSGALSVFYSMLTGNTAFAAVWYTAAGFFITQLVSFINTYSADSKKQLSVGQLILKPLFRVFYMIYLVPFALAFSWLGFFMGDLMAPLLLVFLVVKLVLDSASKDGERLLVPGIGEMARTGD